MKAVCPSCRHSLVVDPHSTERWLTCPRCLATVGNPNVLVQGEPGPPIQSSGPEVSSSLCPECDQPVRPGWRFCPFCEAPLGMRHKREPALENQVKGDNVGSWIGAGLLLFMLLAGVILFFAYDGPRLFAEVHGDSSAVFGVPLVVAALVVVASIVVLLASKKHTVRLIFGIFGGIVAGLGLVFLGVALFCLTFLSICTPGPKH